MTAPLAQSRTALNQSSDQARETGWHPNSVKHKASPLFKAWCLVLSEPSPGTAALFSPACCLPHPGSCPALTAPLLSGSAGACPCRHPRTPAVASGSGPSHTHRQKGGGERLGGGGVIGPGGLIHERKRAGLIAHSNACGRFRIEESSSQRACGSVHATCPCHCPPVPAATSRTLFVLQYNPTFAGKLPQYA